MRQLLIKSGAFVLNSSFDDFDERYLLDEFIFLMELGRCYVQWLESDLKSKHATNHSTQPIAETKGPASCYGTDFIIGKYTLTSNSSKMKIVFSLFCRESAYYHNRICFAGP